MEMKKVQSSDLHSAGHEGGVGLRVLFHAKECQARKHLPCNCDGGPAYVYQNVTAEEHAALVSSPHPGAHLHRHIIARHTGIRE